MHVLITNDDGPLNDETSPYIKTLVDYITETTDWDLSIVVPNQQRSWIGKAHFADKDLTATFIYPNDPNSNSFLGPFHEPQPELASKYKEWALVDGTPASCADIGCNHLYKEKGPVDLVLSGPNFGRNTTAAYISSSGTVGASMEAALGGVKAIGVSYGFEDREMTPEQVVRVQEAAKITIKLVDYLYNNWNGNADLYTVNIPLIDGLKLGETKIFYAPILENRWKSLFTQMIPRREDSQADIVDGSTKRKVQFMWKPDFNAVHESVLKSEEEGIHNDGLVLHQGHVSVTPLKAIFKDVPLTGEIELDISDLSSKVEKTTIAAESVLLSIDRESYIYPALYTAILNNIPEAHIVSELPKSGKSFQYGEYEDLDFDRIHMDDNYLVNSYIYRKALIRKHYLAHTIHSYIVKNPTSALIDAFPETYQLEVDYAEFLEDSLDEAYELRDEIETGKKTWILKPSMSDRGQGIRIFKTIDQLQKVFDSFEEDDTDDEGEECSEGNHGVITSQLRHFVVQEYQANPLLLKDYDEKKFHFRVYVLANGAIEVFVYKRILTLFALTPYTKPTENDDDEEIQMFGHLTNTCLQGEEASLTNNSVVEFAELKGVSEEDKEKIFSSICAIVGEMFKAAVSVDRMNFQPLKNAFEIYGLDFLVNDDLSVKLLEINAFPDFKQTGDDLKGLIYDLFDSVVTTCVVPFFGGEKKDNDLLVKVLDENTDGW